MYLVYNHLSCEHHVQYFGSNLSAGGYRPMFSLQKSKPAWTDFERCAELPLVLMNAAFPSAKVPSLALQTFVNKCGEKVDKAAVVHLKMLAKRFPGNGFEGFK